MSSKRTLSGISIIAVQNEKIVFREVIQIDKYSIEKIKQYVEGKTGLMLKYSDLIVKPFYQMLD